ncbi:hypothetical protein [Vibrio harveyi]|uniref:hypothetical protein n=1 Tax=Vibrio harveyi TaxID=669 RepID=UPI003D705A46
MFQLSEVITQHAATLVSPLTTYLRKNPVHIYMLSGDVTRSFFISKATAYAQLESIRDIANSELNSHNVIEESFNDLDERLESFTLSSGTTFEISQHRILW